MKKLNYMQNSLSFCLYANEIVQKFSNVDIILYGTDQECYRFIQIFSNHLRIKYIINHYDYNDLEQMEAEDLNKIRYIRKNEPIFILSRNYWFEIVAQLEREDYILGVDLFFWEQGWPLDDIVSNFIKHNKKIWKSEEISFNNKVLIPFENGWHDVSHVSLSYCGNYLANLYDAEIWCYIRYGKERELMYKSKSSKEVAKSYNVTNILDIECDQSQIIRARKLFSQIWSMINSWRDLRNIEINGINFGISIIRDYLRFFVPSLNLKTNSFAQHLWFLIQRIVFLLDYFQTNKDIKAIILWDGVCRESFLRDIAISHGIPVYAIHYSGPGMKCNLNFHFGDWFKYYKDFFQQLSPQEQKLGIEWAKRSLEARFAGSKSEISYMKKSIYSVQLGERVLEQNDKIKVIICPHVLEDDLYGYGWQIFSCMIEWLDHLGKLSEQTDYDWYLKCHPAQGKRDEIFLKSFLEQYPKIKLVPTWTSPKQLKEEGIKYAFTIWGTIGHEYPALGIKVINAGNNPHIAFDFDLNPKTEEEFDNIVFNLDKLEHKVDIQEIYKFYCIHYLYYNAPSRPRQGVFFKTPELYPEPGSVKATPADLVKRYKIYLDEWDPEFHEVTKRKIKDLFLEMDNYKEDVFYKKDIKLINEKLSSMDIETI